MSGNNLTWATPFCHQSRSDGDQRPVNTHRGYAGRGLFGRFKSRLEAVAKRRALADELKNLSDRELADLGISRHDFTAILDGTYRK